VIMAVIGMVMTVTGMVMIMVVGMTVVMGMV
jgi:hypothetical protein